MNKYEEKILKQIVQELKLELSRKIIAIYAFGSKIRGDFDEWSDFDILVIINRRTPVIEKKIMSIFGKGETKSGLSFTPIIKDAKAFEKEKLFHTPFYENIMREGIAL